MSDQQNLPIKEEKKEAAVAAEGQKKLKPCCACPETKRARDQWYVCRLDYLLFFLLFEMVLMCKPNLFYRLQYNRKRRGKLYYLDSGSFIMYEETRVQHLV